VASNIFIFGLYPKADYIFSYMRSFLKILLASFTAIILAWVVLFFLGVSIFSKAAEPDIPEVKEKTVLVIDVSKPIREQRVESGISIPEGKTPDILGLFDIVRAIKQAENDSLVRGIYLKAESNSNGRATTSELRNALISFKSKGKFIIAFGDYLTQRAYELANVADSIYTQPNGLVDWRGYALQLTFFKNALDKLEIEPEIFYAGQFKSATEPFRYTKMSEPNRLQLTQFVGELYSGFLANSSKARGVDTATLRSLADNLLVQSAATAAQAKIITAARYDDEVKSTIRNKLSLSENDKINFLPIADYVKNANWNKSASKDVVGVLYAEGDIVDGSGDDDNISGERFRSLIRKLRTDDNVKAVVLRVNSPGGSSIASESIWREITLCKKVKPVVVSMGDYAASGGYFISCNADSIFAQPNTLTGSIGVFSMYFNAQQLFQNKLGITFDEVKTNPHADFGSIARPMSDLERKVAQGSVDSIYLVFKQKVSEGRKIPSAVVDSIAQGRIWSGNVALKLKLIDKIGGLQDAIDCAARMAKLNEYRLRELPVVENFWKKLLTGNDESKNDVKAYAVKETIGDDEYQLISQFGKIKNWSGVPQMRLPFFATFK
jgi:protease-4